MRAKYLVQADRRGIGIDRLRRIEVERPGIDVGAVRREVGVCAEPELYQPGRRRVGGERGALARQGNQDVAIHAAAEFLAGAVEREMGAAPQAEARRETVIVFAGRLHAANLKERTRAEDTVAVRKGDAAVEIARGL